MYDKSDVEPDYTDFEYTEGPMAIELWYGKVFDKRGDIASATCFVCGVYTTCHVTGDGYMCMGHCYQNVSDIRCDRGEMRCRNGSECHCLKWMSTRSHEYPASMREDGDVIPERYDKERHAE